MSRFKRTKIKSSKKSSVSINEKIALLNQELKKTGMLSEMGTEDFYQSVSDVPNAMRDAWDDTTHDGLPIAASFADFNIGAPPIGNVAYSPPHPVDGTRRRGSIWYGIASGFGAAVIPSGGITGIMWIFNQALSSGFGRYVQLLLYGPEDNKQWGTYISTAFGTEMLVPYNHASAGFTPEFKADLDAMDINRFRTPEEFRNETNVQTRTDPVGDPTFLPIDLFKKFVANTFDAAQEGYDYLKEKAQEFVETSRIFGDKINKGIEKVIDKTIDWTKETADDVIDTGIEWLDNNIDIDENGKFDWYDVGQSINEVLDQVTYKNELDAFNRLTAPLWDMIPGKPDQWIEDKMQDANKEILDAINFIQEKFTGEDLQTSVNWMDKYSDESRKTNSENDGQKQESEVDMTEFTTQSDLNYLTKNVSEGIQTSLNNYKENIGNNEPLTDFQKKSLESLGIDTTNITTQEDFNKELLKSTINSEVSNAINNNDALANSMGGMPGTWVDDADIDALLETGNLEIHKGNQSDKAGYKFDQESVDPHPMIDFLAGLVDVNPDVIGAGSITSVLGAILGSKLGLNTHYDGQSSGSDAKDVQNTPPMPWKVTFPINMNVSEKFSNWKNNQLLETTKKKKRLPFGGLKMMGFDGNLHPPLTKTQIEKRKFVIPKNKRHLLKKKKIKESLNEGVKLGHFDPEVLNVDIKDLRKGIMPEYPKKAPPEMIDGYSAGSRLAPKVIKGEPTIKITKKDLAKFHKLKKSEIEKFMKEIEQINAYLQKNPGDLIHVQHRYPKNDPRLAQLNWKMDQMSDASSKYLDKNFKVNQTSFKLAQDRVKKNTALTNPDYIQKHYDELRGTTKPEPRINRKSPSRFFKKPKKKSSMEAINDKIKQLDKDLLI